MIPPQDDLLSQLKEFLTIWSTDHNMDAMQALRRISSIVRDADARAAGGARAPQPQIGDIVRNMLHLYAHFTDKTSLEVAVSAWTQQLTAAGGARAPQWQPAFERFMREFAEWKDDDQAGYDDLLNISDRFYEAAAASGAGPSPPHEAGK